MEKTISKKPLYVLHCYKCGYTWNSNSRSKNDSCPICFYLEKIDLIIKDNLPKINQIKIERNKNDIIAKYDLYNIEVKIILTGHFGAGIWIQSTKGREHAAWSVGIVDSHVKKLLK